MGHRDDHVALFDVRLDLPVSIDDLFQRKTPIDRGLDRTSFPKPLEVEQIIPRFAGRLGYRLSAACHRGPERSGYLPQPRVGQEIVPVLRQRCPAMQQRDRVHQVKDDIMDLAVLGNVGISGRGTTHQLAGGAPTPMP